MITINNKLVAICLRASDAAKPFEIHIKLPDEYLMKGLSEILSV